MYLVLAPLLIVAPYAPLSGVPSLARPSGRACGREGQVMGAAVALLDQMADPSDRRTTYGRTYTKLPVGVLPVDRTLSIAARLPQAWCLTRVDDV